MSAQDLLFELGTEELPPRALQSLSAALTEGVVSRLEAAGIPHGKVRGFATPRRLAVLIQKLAEHQPDKQVEKRGPPVSLSFDPQGAPTQAAMAFAKNCGVAAAELTRSAAGAALAALRCLVADPMGLLRAFAKTPEPITQRMARPEWLLDGWEPVYLLWQCAEGPAGRHGTLVQMARLVPSLPREALDWITSQAESPSLRRPIELDPNSGNDALGRGLAARNERLRALAT